MSEKEFIPTVTLSVKQHDELRKLPEELQKQLDEVDQALQALFQVSVDDLLVKYEEQKRMGAYMRPPVGPRVRY